MDTPHDNRLNLSEVQEKLVRISESRDRMILKVQFSNKLDFRIAK
jgi:hypothetical protein